MITDSQTNFVYIADTLETLYPEFAEDLVSIFKKANIPFGILPHTKDAWAVDYMPVQVSANKFVRFTYKPDYLITTKKWSKTISDVDAICEAIGIQTIKSDIILDGGNLSKWNDKVLMTSKVFVENKHISEMELIEQLQNLLEVNKVIFVPVENGDWFGHADGMARFICYDTVLINDYSQEEQKNYIDFLGALHNAGLKWEIFPYEIYNNEDDNDAAGLYLNYLELENHLILPVYDKEADDMARIRAKEIFPDKEFLEINGNEPAKHTGIINCLTWNIRR